MIKQCCIRFNKRLLRLFGTIFCKKMIIYTLLQRFNRTLQAKELSLFGIYFKQIVK